MEKGELCDSVNLDWATGPIFLAGGAQQSAPLATYTLHFMTKKKKYVALKNSLWRHLPFSERIECIATAIHNRTCTLKTTATIHGGAALKATVLL